MTIISKHISPKAMPKTIDLSSFSFYLSFSASNPEQMENTEEFIGDVKFSRDVLFSEDDVLDGDEKFVGVGI